MLAPNNRKFRKDFKSRNRGIAKGGTEVCFGDYGLKAAAHSRITARQLEAARRAVARHVKRGGQIVIRIFPDKPISKKPLEVRQGKGKGSVEYWVALVQPGRVMFEIAGVPEELAREAFARAAAKLPVKVVFVKREH